jgi:DNA-binding protein YbaB
MFEKFKQLNELRKLQQLIRDQKVEHEKNGVRVVMRGDFEIIELTINPSLASDTQAHAIKNTINEARVRMQALLSKNLGGMAGLS